ncbi:hypothetical protein [Marinibacterium sp. SX1]|uniref:hypothetical protein n=1 Tax=Marinibacterium sp. SX1 TaxID=3388424 RepID=UPI003D181359
MHRRSEYRAIAKAALSAHADLASFTVMSAWARDIDPKTLPVFGVATPGETKRLDSLDTSERACTLMVVLKILGGDDIEDRLDVLGDAAEAAILSAMAQQLGPERPCTLTDTEVVVDGGGTRRVGTLTMKFEVMAWLVEDLSAA